MILSQDNVYHVAKLAKIAVSPQECDSYAVQLGMILSFVGQLNELGADLDAASPTFQITGLLDVVREDETTQSEKADALVNCFPKKEGRFLSVPSFLSKE